MTTQQVDTSSISINQLLIPLSTGIGLSPFSLPSQPCHILLTVRSHLLPHCLKPSSTDEHGVIDDWDTLGLGKSVNYSALGKVLYKEVASACEQGKVRSLEELADFVAQLCGKEYPSSLQGLDIQVERPRALLFAESVLVQKSFTFQYPANTSSSTEPPSFNNFRSSGVSLQARNIQVETIIGLHPHERAEKQKLELDVEIDLAALAEELPASGFDYKTFASSAQEYLQSTTFRTLESLAHNLLKTILPRIPVSPAQKFSPSAGPSNDPSSALRYTEKKDVQVRIQIRKPAAIAFAKCPSIEMIRTLRFYDSSQQSPRVWTSESRESESPLEAPVLAYIAIGTNLGDRIKHIQNAVGLLPQVAELSGTEDEGSVKVKRVSRLYESRPMYVLDQGEFINGVIEIETTLPPLALLLHLKRIENKLGRIKTIQNGPRVIDLDLTYYGTDTVRIGQKGDREGKWDVPGAGWLEVPHWAIGEREFVLRPLLDLTPDLVHPGYGKTVSELLVELEDPNEPPALLPIIPFPSPSLPVQNNPYRPVIMGILNVTPDSFSDGSANRVVKDESSSLEHVLQLARDLVADGAGILDIGGMSTRPGVDDKDVSVEEELARVVPVIQALRIEGIKVPISIDTFRPEVAEQAILAGASCINDVRGGREEGMLEVMAKMDVPVVLMHSRGDSKEMLADKAKNYDDLGGVVAGVNQELKETVRRAEQAGIKRWNIILDPGIGFAKTLEGNLKLLKSLEELFGKGSGLEGFAALIGASRKGFIGTILDKPIAKDREWGNAVVSARAASSGVVDIVRVHEPSPARDVITMTGAIYAS